MNIKEYISSGILESYALGELTETERLEVERNLAQYPELRKELAAIEETMESFFMQAGRKPRAHVKTNVLAGAGDSRELKPETRNPKPEVRDNVLAMWRYAAAASIVVALTSGFMAYNFWSNWKETEASLMELRALNEQVARDYNQVNQRLNAIEQEVEIIGNPSFARVVLKGTENAPNSSASVYWNQGTEEVYLSVQVLAALAHDKQYQLWAIVDGKPVDMGVFDGPASDSGISGLLKMKTTGKAAAFAITIEPRGGKASPTLETMQVLGNT